MSLKTVQVIINGVSTTLNLNSQTGKYEATVTAPNTRMGRSKELSCSHAIW